MTAVLVTAGLGFALIQATPVEAHGVTMVPGSRTWLCYQDGLRPNGEIITPAVGLIFDGQSIPILLWLVLGMSPFTGKSREAALIHDHLCKVQDRTYQEAARVMYECCRSRGMWFRAPLIYRGLLIGGSKW